MILILVSFIALVYSLTVQSKRAIKKMQTPAYKKTPEYQEFEKQLNDLIKTNFKVQK